MGKSKMVTIIAPNPPKATNRMASFPLPSSMRWWPGNTDKTVPSSGTPRNMEGINSKSAWEMDIDIKNTPKTSGDKNASAVADDANTKAPTVLTCIPGIKPVTAPQMTPIMQAKMRSKI